MKTRVVDGVEHTLVWRGRRGEPPTMEYLSDNGDGTRAYYTHTFGDAGAAQREYDAFDDDIAREMRALATETDPEEIGRKQTAYFQRLGRQR